MSDESALLAAILAHPDEDTPRLAFADWLQENGQPEQAEFIRTQCAPDADEAAAERAVELEERNRAKWLAGLPQFPGARWEFRRGFPEYLDVPGELFLDRYSAFAGAPWLRFLSLSALDNQLVRDLLSREWSPRCVELYLEEDPGMGDFDGYDGTPGIVALANSPKITQLRVLRLYTFTLGRGADPALAALRDRFGDRLQIV